MHIEHKDAKLARDALAMAATTWEAECKKLRVTMSDDLADFDGIVALANEQCDNARKARELSERLRHE